MSSNAQSLCFLIRASSSDVEHLKVNTNTTFGTIKTHYCI